MSELCPVQTKIMLCRLKYVYDIYTYMQSQSGLFEKNLNRIGELVKLTTTKIQINKIKDKQGKITIDFNETQGIFRKYL